MEIFKILDADNLQWLVDILNDWWNQGECPANMLRATVASLFKKGDPKKQSNYRLVLHISLRKFLLLYAYESGLFKTRIHTQEIVSGIHGAYGDCG